jgi:hypothetical protein
VLRLKSWEAFQAILAHVEAHLPAEVAAIGGSYRIKSVEIGDKDPISLTEYDTIILTPLPVDIDQFSDSTTIQVPLCLTACVKDSDEEEVRRRQTRYGDALVNLILGDTRLGGAVLCVPRISSPKNVYPSKGEKMIGYTMVEFIVELNLLGG